MGYGIPPSKILAILAHSGELIAEELICTDSEAVDEVGKAFSVHAPGCETTGSLLGEHILRNGRLPRFGWYAPAVIHPLAELDQSASPTTSSTGSTA
jgi:hypothetical protein